MIRLYLAQVAAAIRTGFSDRANFAMQVGGMALNDVFFLALWVLFFAGFRSVGGWGLSDMALLMGMAMIIVGAAGVFLGGYRDLAAAILRGELDALLTQPKALLPRLLARESLPTGWGDLLMGPLVLLAADLSWSDAPLLAVGLVAGLIVYVSAAVTFAAMAFWIAGARTLARDLTDFTLLFSTYPASIFSGPVKWIAFTVLPAGFVVMTPVRFLREPSLEVLAMVLGAAAAYGALALGLFSVGVRRYRSGACPTLGGA